MKSIVDMSDAEVEALSLKIIHRLEKLLPRDVIFIVIMGSEQRHRTTLSNTEPEFLSDYLRHAAKLAQQAHIENN